MHNLHQVNQVSTAFGLPEEVVLASQLLVALPRRIVLGKTANLARINLPSFSEMPLLLGVPFLFGVSCLKLIQVQMSSFDSAISTWSRNLLLHPSCFSNSETTIFPRGSIANRRSPEGSNRNEDVDGISWLQRDSGSDTSASLLEPSIPASS